MKYKPVYEYDKLQVSRNVRKYIESEEMKDILDRKFKTQTLFLIAAMLLTLKNKGFEKEELIEFQQSFSDTGRELAKETNSVDLYSALTRLEAETGIKYNKKTDMFE